MIIASRKRIWVRVTPSTHRWLWELARANHTTPAIILQVCADAVADALGRQPERDIGHIFEALKATVPALLRNEIDSQKQERLLERERIVKPYAL